MDKKNTMLLTVIAVATLLVAVVGATFAYFSIQTGETSGTTSVQGTVATAGVVTGTVNEDNQLKISLTTADMAYEKINTTYYAVSVKDATNNYSTTSTSHKVFGASLANAAEGETYTCTYDLNVELTSTTTLASGDVKVVISGTNTADKTYDAVDDFTSNKLTFSNLAWKFTSADSAEKDVMMTAYIQNTEDKQNDSLSNANISIKTTVENFTCKVTK